MSHRRREWILGVALALLSFIYYLSYAGAFLDNTALNDEGLAIVGALRVMAGERPLVDFWSYPPGRYWLAAGAMHLFGTTILVNRVLLAALMAAKNALVFGVARRVMPPGPAIAAAATVALVPGPWHKVYYSLLMFAQLALLMRYLDKPTARRAAACGLGAGIAFYFRQDSAAYGLAACAVLISAILLPQRRVTAWLAHGGIVLGAFAAAMMPMAWLYADEAALTLRRLGPDPVAVAEVVYDRIHFMAPAKLGRYFLAHLADWPHRWFLRGFFPWAAVAVAGAGAATLAAGMRSVKKERGAAPWAWAAVVVWSCLSMMKVYKQPNLEAVLMAGQGAVVMGAAMAWGWTRLSWRGATIGSLRAAAWALLGLAWVHLLAMAVVPIEGLETGSIAESLGRGRTAVLRTDRATLRLAEDQAATLNALIDTVRRHAPPDQPIYAWQQPMLYVLCERMNATATESVVPPIVLEDWRSHFREVFTHRPPPVQVLDANPKWLNRLDEYPADLQQRMFTGYALAADLGDYLVLTHTGEGDCRDAVMQRIGRSHASMDD